MLARLLRSQEKTIAAEEDVALRAGRYFASGMNCAQAVLKATTGRDDAELMAVAKAFGGGVGNSKCLCGAVNGGVMALALAGKGKRAADLMAAFREKNGAACCSALTRQYQWKSREHLENCRRLTEETAALVGELLK